MRLKAKRMAGKKHSKKPGDKLTAKQEAFYRAYLETGNATEAYRRSYDVSGMKPETINRCAHDLFNHPKISARLAERDAELKRRAEDRYFVSKERIIRELALIGLSNMMDYVTPQEDGTAYVDLSKLTRDQAAAINEVTVECYTEKEGEKTIPVKRVKFKLSDKRAALVDLGRHLNLFPTQVSGKIEHDHKHDHQHRAISETSEWVAGVLRRGTGRAPKESLPN